MSRFTPRRVALAVVVSIVGAGLLVWQVRRAGLGEIQRGLQEVGWGFLVILGLSFARFTLRSFAWTTLMGANRFLPRAVGATLAGDAIGNLTPLSLLVSEPAKSIYLRDQVSGTRSFAALTAENFFYSVSVAVFIILGTLAMLQAFAVPPELRLAGVASLALMTVVLAGALWVAWREPALFSGILRRIPVASIANLLSRVRRFEANTYAFLRQSHHPLGVVLSCETSFHVLSFAEAVFTIWLMTGRWAPLAAFVLDTFNRIVNIVFRAVPLRMGVDEAGTAIVAPAVGFTPALGVTLALVRKGRMLVWAAIGVALAIRKGLTLRDVIDRGQPPAPAPTTNRTPSSLV